MIQCYLLRDDGEFFALGTNYGWRISFAVFPGPPDGSVYLTEDDVTLLALRLEGLGYPLDVCRRFATAIIRWGSGHSMRFVSALDPEIDLGVEPSPLTGSIDGL